MLKLVHTYFPDEVGPLPDFNGGGHSKEASAYFLQNPITLEGLHTANYYIQLPWSWVHFLGESRCAATQSCRPLKLQNH
jgi:hypothetical protein